jgi:hypothetical protein
MDQDEKSIKRHSLGVVIPPKSKDITVVVQGGVHAQETVDPARETSSETTGLVEDKLAGSDEVSGDVCDGRAGDKAERSDGNNSCKCSNEENSTQK